VPYRVVDTKTWDDPKVLGLSSDARTVFLYLITSPLSHLSGLYILPTAIALYHTGLSEDRWRRALDTLSIGHLALFDHATSCVWVVNMLRYQGSGPKVVVACVNHLGALHNSFLIREFLERYPEVKARVPDRVWDRVSIGVPSGSGSGSGSGTENPPLYSPPAGGDGVGGRSGVGKAGKVSKIEPPGFEAFYAAYPRKVKRPDALRAWRQVGAEDHLPTVLAGVESWRRSSEWCSGAVHYPATWLRSRMWEDDPTPPGAGNGVVNLDDLPF
jgi:hypothetical protein